MSESIDELRNYILSKNGYNYDTEIPEELFEESQERLNKAKRTWVSVPSYRDQEKFSSLHISDYRELDRGKDHEEGVIVGHVERFNPDFVYLAPLQTLIDTLLWIWKNRIIEKNSL